MQTLDNDNLREIVEKQDTVVVQYMATWCGNCRLMKPKFKKLAKEKPDATFLMVDAEKNPESRKMANVDNLPTFAIFKDGAFKDQVQTNKYEILKNLVDENTDH